MITVDKVVMITVDKVVILSEAKNPRISPEVYESTLSRRWLQFDL